MSQNDRFGPSVRNIEENIIVLMSETTIFSTRDIHTSKILAYFITRKDLTQKEIHELTGISAGKISQEINKMVEQNLISIKERSSTGQITYTMGSVGRLTNTRAINLINSVSRWDDRFEEIKKDMEDPKKNLKELNGYNKIKSLVDFYYGVIQKIKQNKQKWNFKSS